MGDWQVINCKGAYGEWAVGRPGRVAVEVPFSMSADFVCRRLNELDDLKASLDDMGARVDVFLEIVQSVMDLSPEQSYALEEAYRKRVGPQHKESVDK